jgi:transposase
MKLLAVTSLRRLYHKHGVKIKKVRQEKMMPLSQWQNFDIDKSEVVSKLLEAKTEGRKVIFLDEICFTKRSFLGTCWSKKYENISVDQKQVYQGFYAAIASCSSEKGIEAIFIHNKAINHQDFIKYLKKLKRKSKVPIALFMDKLAVHRHKEVKLMYEALNIKPIFNVGYSPEFNPIESVFSQVKRSYNKARLNKLANGEIFD